MKTYKKKSKTENANSFDTKKEIFKTETVYKKKKYSSFKLQNNAYSSK